MHPHPIIGYIIIGLYGAAIITAIVFAIREFRKPPVPQTSDVVKVVIYRTRSDGKVARFTLLGNAASKYGYLSTHGAPCSRYTELLPEWKREILDPDKGEVVL